MTNAELAILTLLNEKPRHGYEIEQVIEERGFREWTELGFSSIYYILNKVEQKGWVESKIEAAENGPSRRVYRLTPAGTSVLREAVTAALSHPTPGGADFLLGLANLPVLSPDAVDACLSSYRDALANQLDVIMNRRLNQTYEVPLHVQAMFDYSFAGIQSELDWVERFLRHRKSPPQPTFSKEVSQ